MNEFNNFFTLGIEHIWGVDALDHWLFLLALALPFTLTQWKQWLWPVTGFTIGHAVALVLSINNIIQMDAAWVEVLIPLTIVLSVLIHVVMPKISGANFGLITLAFGAIHGLGFSNVLRELLLDSSIAVPLLGFNIGVELGQLVFLAAVLLLLQGVEKTALSRKVVNIGLGGIVGIWGGYLFIERLIPLL